MESNNKNNNFIQVPVINKTESLFARDTQNPSIILKEISLEAQQLIATEPYTITAKTDGTCGIICCVSKDSYLLMRRQDIRLKSRNYDMVVNNGESTIFAGSKCFVTKMIRGSGKSERIVPLYIFQLTENNKPEIEYNHVIGFTPILHDFADDKYAVTAIDGINGSPELKLFTTVFSGNLDVEVKSVLCSEILQGNNLLTVEILGSKISNKYGFSNDNHIINIHGSITYPTEHTPELNYDYLKKWFESDSTNRWANVEGIVIHFPLSNRRFKVHRGHVDLESTWKMKKESGIKFIH